jgi:hypothetical protein
MIELPTWYDVDDAESLRRLQQDLLDAPVVSGPQPYRAPATMSALRRMGLPHRLPRAAE